MTALSRSKKISVRSVRSVGSVLLYLLALANHAQAQVPARSVGQGNGQSTSPWSTILLDPNFKPLGTGISPLVTKEVQDLTKTSPLAPKNPILPSSIKLTDGGKFASLVTPGNGPTVKDVSLVVAASPTPALQCPFRVGISQTASAVIVSGVPGKNIFYCANKLISATAQSVSLIEGTGSTCGTGTLSVDGASGGTNSLAANGGWAVISDRIVNFTSVPGNDLCLAQSSTGNVSGFITYGFY